MSIFLFKSFLSFFLFISTLIALYTMFEVYGRSERRFDIEKLKKIHKVNGFIFAIFTIFISFLCLGFIAKTKSELSARSVFHSIFALTVIFLLLLKVLFAKVYRQFYGKLQTAGILLGFLSMGMISTSAGYYLLITEFGNESSPAAVLEKKNKLSKGTEKIIVKTDAESIARGKELYESKCYFCHDAYSTKKGVGPGHKSLMKNLLLPVSGRPSTPENIANQIKNPFKDMPSFSYLSNRQIEDIIAFLNTL